MILPKIFRERLDGVETSIIIPCYFLNQELIDTTVACVSSLSFGKPDEVIIVDDGSPLSAPELTAHPFADQFIQRDVNGGYAKAVNSGLSAARGEVLIVSNNDIYFTPGWMEAIMLPLKAGADISSIRTSDNGYELEDKVTQGDKFGSLWAMKREVYDKLGGLSEEFGRGYAEDLDYRRRALNEGFTVAKNHGHLVEHEAKATFKQVDPEDTSYRKALRIYKKKWKTLE